MKTFLYLKTHNVTGLKYLGKTTKDPVVYEGSGKYWKRHIKQHGYDVTTEILAECNTKEEVVSLGLYYSNLWNVVDSDEFANLKPEMGDGGSNGPMPEKQRLTLSESKRGSGNGMFGRITVNNGTENLVISKDDVVPDGYVRGQLQRSSNKIAANKLRVNPNANKVWITKNGESALISNNANVPEGWVLGRKVNKRWITNGIDNKFVDISYNIPDNWYIGRSV